MAVQSVNPATEEVLASFEEHTPSQVDAVLNRSVRAFRDWRERSFAGQFRQALQNILEVLEQARGRPEHIVRLTWYVLDKQEYLGALQEVGTAYRELMGRHFPVMAVVQVSGLVEDEARLEIEATAVIPEDRP